MNRNLPGRLARRFTVIFCSFAAAGCLNAQQLNCNQPLSLKQFLSKYAGYFALVEDTKGEAVSVNQQSGRLWRWAASGGDDQRWIIYPVGVPLPNTPAASNNINDYAFKYRIQSKQNGEFMTVGANAGWLIRWTKQGDNTQAFAFTDPVSPAPLACTYSYHIVEPTNSELVSVGSDGFLVRWQPMGMSKGQRFFPLLADFVTPPKAPAPEKEIDQIPPPPALRTASLDKIPMTGPRYLVQASVLSALGVNDPNFQDKITQMNSSPYYTLKRYQYWDRSGMSYMNSGQASNGRTFQIQNGFSQTDLTSVVKTVGYEISGGIELSGEGSKQVKVGDSKEEGGEATVGGKLGAKLSLAVKYTNQTQTTNSSSTTTSNVYTQTISVQISGTTADTAVIGWTLVDEFVLTPAGSGPGMSWKFSNPVTTSVATFPVVDPSKVSVVKN